jgi:hypothetical protein
VKRCYAESLGDCRGGMSREHFISKSLLQQLDRSFTAEGFDPSDRTRMATVSAASLAAAVLCEGHNTRLSPVDAGAAPFFAACRRFDHELGRPTSPPMDTIVADGSLVERWMAKALLGLLARAGSTGVPSPEHSAQLLAVAFGSPSRPPHGLYLDAAPGHAMYSEPDFSLVTLTRPNGECAGVFFAAGSLRWIYPLGQPDLLPPEAYRPNAVILRAPGKERRLELTWPGDYQTLAGTVWLSRATFSSETHPDLFRPTVDRSFGSIRPM